MDYKQVCCHVRNTANDCFKWAFLAGMYPTKRHSERLKKYESFQSKYDFSPLTYPVPLNDIDTFCRRNNCSINVYGISDGKDDQDDIEGDDIEDDQEDDMMISKMMLSKMKMMISKMIIKKSIPNVMLTRGKRKEWYTH